LGICQGKTSLENPEMKTPAFRFRPVPVVRFAAANLHGRNLHGGKQKVTFS